MAEGKILRSIPVRMALFEVETKDGRRLWTTAYVADVDGEEVGAPVRALLGAQSAQEALERAAERPFPF